MRDDIQVSVRISSLRFGCIGSSVTISDDLFDVDALNSIELAFDHLKRDIMCQIRHDSADPRVLKAVEKLKKLSPKVLRDKVLMNPNSFFVPLPESEIRKLPDEDQTFMRNLNAAGMRKGLPAVPCLEVRKESDRWTI